ncbi:MFS transporter permease [Nocardioides sp. Root1257]|uniref:MFS transporter n=1 Tax=unclassified Nocardioides TaxID=2615069 RepID=UPI0007009843|nr:MULTISPECIES: MFS transporter [unclassified Nocardioides]KQW47829.1 MFS transporter permease [Nocardioides sp. Root1257]KRC45081.1 MFS transporter permease [Nocardioides sp. Root224]
MSSRRPLYGWLTAEAISLTGTRVSMIALPWFVLTTTGSPTRTGLVALAEMLPLVVLKVLSGPVIDRVGARRVSIACDVASVAAVGAIPLLHEAGMLTFPVLLVLVALAGALRGPGDAAKAALTPAVVAAADVPMERATGLHSTVERTAGLLGAAGAAGLVAAIGAADALLVDALSFGASAAVLAATTRTLRKVGSDEEDDPASYGARLRAGWDFLRGDRVLLGITVMVALTNLLDAAYITVLVPVWSKEVVGSASGVALLFAFFGGSAAVGALCASAWGARMPRRTTYLVAFLLAGAPRFVVMALDSPVWLVVGTCAVAGFAAGFINPILGAVIFERIPTDLTGRVSALTTAMCFALIPFGGVLGGLLVSGVGLTPALLAVGVAYFVVTMLPAVDPHWRELDRRPSRALEPAAVSG